jgi:putative intracellular protease/amidase
LFDIATDPVSHSLIAEFWECGKIVSAVCHGSAALMDVKMPNGSYLIDGARVTGFSEAEEQSMAAMPFSLERKLNERSGGRYEKAESKHVSHIVVEGRLITGQNPASAADFGKDIRASL